MTTRLMFNFVCTHRWILFRLQRRSLLPRHLPGLRSRLVVVRGHIRGGQRRCGNRWNHLRQHREEVRYQVQGGRLSH